MRNKNNCKTSSLLHLLCPRFNFIPNSFFFSMTEIQGDREWGLWSVCNTSCLLLLPPPTLSLIPWETILWTRPVWVLPTGCSSSRAAPAWVPSTGCSPSGTAAPAWTPLSTGQQVLPGAFASAGSHKLQFVLGKIHMRWQWIFKGLQRRSCLTMVFITVCRGASALVPDARPRSPSMELFFSYFLTPFFQSFSSFLKYYITYEVLPTALMDSALASSRSVLEPLVSSHRSHPCSTTHQNLAT